MTNHKKPRSKHRNAPSSNEDKRPDRRPHQKSERKPNNRSHEGSSSSGGGIWLFGTHAVLAAIANPKRKCRRLLVTSDSRENADNAIADAISNGIDRPSLEVVERSSIGKLLPEGVVHQGLALEVLALEGMAIEDLCRDLGGPSPALVVLIDQGTDPRNMGAVMRSATAFGADALIVQDRHAPDTTGVMAKASSGALEILPVLRVTNLSRALDQLKEAGFWCVGLDGTGSETTLSLKWPEKTALVLGAEGKGLRRLTRENCDHLVKIPMSDAMESLNQSNAAAIALYEIFRSRITNAS